MMNLAVSPAARRQGVARRLVQALLAALEARGAYQLTLEVRVSNHPALALYAGLGVPQVGRPPGSVLQPRGGGMIVRKEWTV